MDRVPAKRPTVIIHVRNGVAECFRAPDGIEVQIVDLDSLDEDELREIDDKVR